MKRRLTALILALACMLCLSVPALAASPQMLRAEYEGRGYVEVDFKTRVQYKNPSVKVTDPAGALLTAKITEKDDDDLTFLVKGLKADTSYSFTISGVRKGRSGSFGSVTGSFSTPKSELSVKEIEYDRRDGELELEFYGRVEYQKPKVVIKNAAGKTFACRISEKDRSGMEIDVRGLASGKYTLKISGLRLKGSTTYKTITTSFRVR